MHDTCYLKLIPYTDYSLVKPLGCNSDTIVSLFDQNFFCKEEMKNGCFLLQERSYGPFVLTKEMLWYISTEINLNEIHMTFKQMTKYKPVVVQDWRTETFLIIEFEWEKNKKTTNIVLTYTNYPLRIGFGRWKTDAGGFLNLLQNQEIPMYHDVTNYYHLM